MKNQIVFLIILENLKSVIISINRSLEMNQLCTMNKMAQMLEMLTLVTCVVILQCTGHLLNVTTQQLHNNY